MAKAIITIDDGDGENFSVQVAFDPPMPETAEERAKIQAPPSALLAGQIMMMLKEMSDNQKEYADQQPQETE